MHLRTGMVLLLASIPGLAQSHGFVYLAPGGQATRVSGHTDGDVFAHVGGGGEYVMKNGLGVGADGGVIGLLFGGTLETLSLDGSYHFRHHRLVDPFAAAGYSVFFDKGHSGFFGGHIPGFGHMNLFNFGGGMNLWFSHHVGAKLEFRDHLRSDNGTIHYAEIMLGLGFH